MCLTCNCNTEKGCARSNFAFICCKNIGTDDNWMQFQRADHAQECDFAVAICANYNRCLNHHCVEGDCICIKRERCLPSRPIAKKNDSIQPHHCRKQKYVSKAVVCSNKHEICKRKTGDKKPYGSSCHAKKDPEVTSSPNGKKCTRKTGEKSSDNSKCLRKKKTKGEEIARNPEQKSEKEKNCRGGQDLSEANDNETMYKFACRDGVCISWKKESGGCWRRWKYLKGQDKKNRDLFCRSRAGVCRWWDREIGGEWKRMENYEDHSSSRQVQWASELVQPSPVKENPNCKSLSGGSTCKKSKACHKVYRKSRTPICQKLCGQTRASE